MKEVEIKVTAEEASAIVQIVGNLPTSSNAWPLLQKIKQQVEAQLTQEPEAKTE